MHAYVEITPFESVKYEIDKETGSCASIGRSAPARSRRRCTDSCRAPGAARAWPR
jgi:hypothetical protein